MRSMIRPPASQIDTQTHNIVRRTLRNPSKGAQRSAAACVRSVEVGVSPSAYLRAALSFKSGTNSPLACRVARNENFASEIFAVNPGRALLRCKLSTRWQDRPGKSTPDQ
jgi:hypothetical protein